LPIEVLFRDKTLKPGCLGHSVLPRHLFKDLLLLSLLFIPVLFGTCAIQEAGEDDQERVREESFLRDLVAQNDLLRSQNAEFRETLLRYESVIVQQNETLQDYFTLLRKQGSEQAHPAERIPLNDIRVTNTGVLIRVPDVHPYLLTDTNSMDPWADNTSKVLAVAPRSEREITVGDIIGYRCSTCAEREIILHRVITVASDDTGVYFIAKGDNNPRPDPDRIRFDQIRTIVIGIIY